MTPSRRTTDRRRRVLYSTHQADQTNSTAASRRQFEQLREARRPTAAYGARVQRRIRGRWFSLVPIKRRTSLIVAGAMSAATLLFCLLHYAAVAWPTLVYHPEVARPFRLDSPDSFGRWYMVAMLTASAGVSLMIYQLRRYRLDDYLGRYRLWRLVLIVMVLASVNALVGLIDWTGALLDLTFGKRVALSGGDWLRVVVGLGGAVLALRVLADVRRSRSSLVAMIFVCAVLLLPQAARWNVMTVDSVGKWVSVTSAPLVATTAIFIALGSYLRLLYREVREIEDSMTLRERLDQWKLRVFTRPESDDVEEVDSDAEPALTRAEKRRLAKEAAAEKAAQRAERDAERQAQRKAKRDAESDAVPSESDGDDASEPQEQKVKRGWFAGLRRKPKPESADSDSDESDDADAADQSTNDAAPTRVKRDAAVQREVAAEQDDAAELDDADESKPKRRWFGLRAAKGPVDETQDDVDADTSETNEVSDDDADAKPAKRRRFGLRLKPKSVAADTDPETPSADTGTESESEDGEETPKRRSGLGGWFGRKKAAAESDDGAEGADPVDEVQSRSDASSGDDEEYIDPDSIDWNSLNKSERRRLKKLIRRQDQAA
ncbi:hypothetical protein K227x_13170 [Rubripirellula lacrimiformis]|uniref:Uncharacterized protein n=1 Tax=Rubripirellula lacrimiformis TaxID=1930273 RepID=A0A517N7G6_9BACT|nr:hypothetical protein [Rubripirellula lacrimiformis]QDT02938.1 hypothetical protein K227x_13170 [Rubripirellula lacrimiformis]